MPTAAFMTLGCKVNQFETETMEGLFKQGGYEIVPFESPADVYVVNTCAVTNVGERKSRQAIRRAARENPEAIIAVCGCYSQVRPEDVKALAGVHVVLGTKERSRIVEYVERAARERGRLLDGVGDVMHTESFEDIPLYDMPRRTRAFLKIEDGCQNFCSYCIIPYARGPVKSRPLAAIRREAEKLVGAGFLEIVLTGIHLGKFGSDLGENINLTDACREVLQVPGLKRLRLGSLESMELSPELFELIRSDERFCPHLHLPLQAGSDRVLREMNRHYDTAEFARLIEQVERELPGVAVSTDIIVGFPGETEEDFAQGLQFAEKMNFSRMHVFPYSRRDGTPAAAREDQVPEPVKKERVHRMQALAERKSGEFCRSFLGKTMRVLFETNDHGLTDGLTDNYIRVYTKDEVTCGEIYQVELLEEFQDGVLGRVKHPVDWQGKL